MLTLSLKNFDDSSDEIDIKHYHIQADLGQSAYYITRSRTFPTLQELIAHYTGKCYVYDVTLTMDVALF